MIKIYIYYLISFFYFIFKNIKKILIRHLRSTIISSLCHIIKQFILIYIFS